MDNTTNNSDTDVSNNAIGPMEVGYILFTAPFILFCIGIAFMVIFNVR